MNTIPLFAGAGSGPGLAIVGTLAGTWP